MRILYISQYYPPATHGGAVCVNHILKGLSKYAEVLHFTAEPKGPIFNNVTTIFGPKFPAIFQHNLSYMVKLRRIIKSAREFKPNVILAQHQVDHMASLTAIFLGKILNVPVVIRAEDIVNGDLPLKQLPIYLYCEILNDLTLHYAKGVSKFLVATSEIVEYLYKNRNFSQKSLGISPNGVSLDMFRNINHPYDYDGDPVLLLMGSMAPADNILLLVKTAPLIIKEHPKVKFVFLGEGPEIERAKALSKKMGIFKHFVFFGKVPHEEVPKYLLGADIGIGPLRPTNENRMTVPLKILEYMAAGLPIVSVQISKDILRNNETGLVLYKDDADELFNSIHSILSDNNLRHKLIENELKIVKNYDWNEIVRNLYNVLENVM